ncbi:type IX secretion system sortase PorU [Hymenobacter saemangeumensis]|uniref:Type IX secretion system sortase PorU n=1 Tax=Hymenobacter saemangeumensis TaxID=1084522 RepID=A0ABP8IJ03_9BACT
MPSRAPRKQKVPTFEKAYHGIDEQVGLFGMRLEGAVEQGQLANVVYEALPPADAKLFDAGRLPAGPEPRLVQGTEMKLPVTHLTVRTVRRNPQTGQPERLVSFDYVYSPNLAATAARRVLTRRHATSSVLATGDWFKVGVAESGIYKLDLATLRDLGVNTQGLDPSRVRIYGNSTGILPQANDVYRPDDLVENAVQFVGNPDNIFDSNEYLLFYSPGAHTWQAQGGLFRHRNNIYTDTTYYFITVGSTPGRRVSSLAPPTAGGSVATISTFAERQFHEHDLANLLRSGRNWVGEGFSPNSQRSFTFNIPDLVPGGQLRVTSSTVARSATASSFRISVSGSAGGSQTVIGTQGLSQLDTYPYAEIAKVSTATYQTALPAGVGPEVRVNMTYTSGDATASGYLDYLVINATRQLRLSGDLLEFRSLENIAPQAVSRFLLSNASDATVWDVTNPRGVQVVAFDRATGSFLASTDTLREYVAFRPNGNFPTPRRFGRVANQNLHALNAGSGNPLDMVIVAYPPFRAEAERLANHRRTRNGLRVAVVTTTEVYNEFGSGGQDVTAIRDLMKQVYDRAPAGKQMHLLLFGDASFDYKSDPFNNRTFEPAWWRDRVPFKTDADFNRANQNLVPTYQSRESLAPFYGGVYGQASYSSDDYFGLLDDNEGEWNELSPGTEMLDIGIGRLPVRTPKGSPNSTENARLMVSKIISYDAVPAYGKWRNRVTMTADDGDNNLFADQSEGIASTIQSTDPAYNIRKVYLDLFPQITVAAGQRSPQTNRLLDESIEQGSLIVNYLGHGGPKGWTDEQIVTNASVMALRNSNNLTFMVTGTCDFSTYDNPDFTSAGEQVMTDNMNGGAVGLFTTTRVVDAGQNHGLNQAFYGRVFRPLSNGRMPSIGTVVRLSKNDYPGPGVPGVINNRNYTLLADPSMVLAYPEQTVSLDNAEKLQTRTNQWVTVDTLQALSRVRLRGRVLNNGAVNTAFNGTAQITIYDKPTTVKTLADEASNTPMDVRIQENVIYGGQASVVNGEYTVTFVVPKDINYNVANGFGKVSLYAFDPSNRVDAHGQRPLRVGGADANAPRDTIPPVIRLFMDDESFVFGGSTGQTTKLLADLSDDSGINTTGAGIGHEITAILDRDPSKLIILNDSYVAKLDNFKAGRVHYLFKDLADGPHSLRVKAWDTYNNSSEEEIEFVVSHNEQLVLNHVLNYPNPFSTNTTFRFDHNRHGDDLDVQVQIFTVAGRLVRTLTATVPASEGHQKGITWNGRDEYDDQLARGVYVYRISVRSPNHGTATKFEKLVILN